LANPEHLKIIKQGVAAWNSWREQDNIVPDLSDANLVNFELDGINFEGARLHGVMFHAAKLKLAKFSGAKLVGSSFTAANLSNADFSHAQLDWVSFLAAYMVGANFFKSELGYTSFANANLQQAIGLETCLHLAPSSVDFNTLKHSGELPKKFLQGCGLPDKFIRNIPSYLDQASKLPSCFISYSTKDEEFARQLYARMIDANIQVWFAPEDLKGGRKLPEQLFEAIQIHDRLLIVLSEHSIQSEWVMTEIRKARETEKKEKRRKLFPIRLTDFETLRDWTCFDSDTGKDLAVEVREYFIPDFSNWKTHDAFESAFIRLRKDLETENAKR
jgi:uncharacterized protein YjbI with pentapeptide repeats